MFNHAIERLGNTACERVGLTSDDILDPALLPIWCIMRSTTYCCGPILFSCSHSSSLSLFISSLGPYLSVSCGVTEWYITFFLSPFCHVVCCLCLCLFVLFLVLWFHFTFLPAANSSISSLLFHISYCLLSGFYVRSFPLHILPFGVIPSSVTVPFSCVNVLAIGHSVALLYCRTWHCALRPEGDQCSRQCYAFDRNSTRYTFSSMVTVLGNI